MPAPVNQPDPNLFERHTKQVQFVRSIIRAVNAGITANPNSGQGDTPLTADVNQISICATAGDAVTLPSALGGLTIIIINDGAQSCDVFPDSGDDIPNRGFSIFYLLSSILNNLAKVIS